jgi:hypothetical protein
VLAENLIRQVGGAIWFRRGPEELVALPGFTRCGMMIGVLLRLAYLSLTNVFALLRLLPVSDQDKDAEILALRHLRSARSRLLVLTWSSMRPARIR